MPDPDYLNPFVLHVDIRVAERDGFDERIKAEIAP